MSQVLRRIIAGGMSAVVLTACTGERASAEREPTHAAIEPVSVDTEPGTQNNHYGQRVSARIFDRDGNRIGLVTAWQTQDRLVIQIEAKDLPPGGHGMHMHQVGDCSDTGTFTNSGGHIAHSAHSPKPHGTMHPDGTHAGDLPNLFVSEDGSVQYDTVSARINIDDLQDTDGAALIIHAAADDYQTQNIGGSGARIACAAFKPRTNG